MHKRPVLLTAATLLSAGLFFMGYRIWRVVHPDIKLVLENGIDHTYQGKYSSDPRYLELLKRAGSMRQEALTVVQQHLNIALGDRANWIVVRFVDLAEDKGQQTQVFGKGDFYRIAEIDVESFLDADNNPEKVLRHELTHAAMEESMRWRYRSLPRWLTEGIAVWVAGQVDDKTAVYVEWALSEGKNPMGLLNGLEAKPHKPEDYVEDGLFFRYLEGTFGIETIQRIIYRIMSREPYRQVFEQELHMGWAEIQQRGRDYALEAIEQFRHRETEGASQSSK